MGYLNDAIKHKKDLQKDQMYESYFDEQKRNIYFKGKIKISNDFSTAQIYQALVVLLTKDLIGFNFQEIILNQTYLNKKDQQLKTKVLDFELQKLLVFEVESRKIPHYITYCLVKKQKNLIIKIKQTTVYPFMLFGAKGSQIRWENKQKFKDFVNLLTKKINQWLQNHSSRLNS